MNIKKYTNTAKKIWNELVPIHQASSSEWLNKSFSKKKFIIQKDKDVLKIFKKIKIENKNIIHLCCNNGTELLSIKNMGANRCVGIDISKKAVEEASKRAKKNKIECEFICCDVFDIPQKLFNKFNVVHLTAGSLGWIPDLELFFNICSKLLKKDGLIFIHEMHPFSEMMAYDYSKIKNRRQIIESYFGSKPIEKKESLDYLGKSKYKSKTWYWFVHTVSDIFMALIKNNFKIEEFIESSKDISAAHNKIEKLKAGIPLSMIVLGKKINK